MAVAILAGRATWYVHTPRNDVIGMASHRGQGEIPYEINPNMLESEHWKRGADRLMSVTLPVSMLISSAAGESAFLDAGS